jgi:hypothetical protein
MGSAGLEGNVQRRDPRRRRISPGLRSAWHAALPPPACRHDNAIENSQEGWAAGLEVNWAITQAGSLDEQAVMQKLQHLNINTLGIVWSRTPANYESYSDVDAAMATINPDGTASLYKTGS